MCFTRNLPHFNMHHRSPFHCNRSHSIPPKMHSHLFHSSLLLLLFRTRFHSNRLSAIQISSFQFSITLMLPLVFFTLCFAQQTPSHTHTHTICRKSHDQRNKPTKIDSVSVHMGNGSGIVEHHTRTPPFIHKLIPISGWMANDNTTAEQCKCKQTTTTSANTHKLAIECSAFVCVRIARGIWLR